MAARHQTYSKWACVAITGGVMLTAIETVGAVGYLISQDQPHYLVAGGAIVTVVAAILPIIAGRCWRDGRVILALLLWAAMVPAMSVIFSAAVERTGGARDAANMNRQVIAQRIELTRAAEQEAKAVADADEAKAATECSRAAKGADPRGPQCKAAEARAEASRQRLQAARDAVAKAGVVPTDPQARRLAAILPVSEEAVQLYQPLVLPLSISALGLMLISVGAHQPKRASARRKKGKPRRRRRKALGSAAKKTNVVPLRRVS